MNKTSYAKAINLALRESMESDKSVFCIGEDVGFGGAMVLLKTSENNLVMIEYVTHLFQKVQ